MRPISSLHSIAVPRKAALACAPLLVAAALGVAACGDDDSELLAQSTAAALTDDLDRVAELASESRCAEASRATQQLAERVDGLPNSIDPELREALSTGVQQLQVLTNEPDCNAEGDQGETATTETQTVTQPPPAQTQPPQTETQTPTQEPPPDEPQEGDGSGGTPPPEGDLPGEEQRVPPGLEGR